MTQLISAYTELEKGHPVPLTGLEDEVIQGHLIGYGPEGLEVQWFDDEDVPSNAQVYIAWERKIVAVWNEETDGEDGNSEDGSEVWTGGEANPQEPDPELGFPGSGNAGEQPAEA